MRKTTLPQIRVPEDGLGPAMQALPNQSMRAYVVGRVYYGLNKARAAQAAGYSVSTPDVAKVQGYRLEHDERIQAAIAEESRKLMRSFGPRSIRTLAVIMSNPKAEDKDRIKAAGELLSRGGLNAVSEGHITVDHNHRLTPAQQDKRILELARELGLNDVEARKLLVDPSKFIDAEFEDVPPEPTGTELEDGREGLEDIL